MVDIKYANSFSEVLEILQYIPKSDYDKIPKEYIQVFEENKNNEHNFRYVPNLTLDEQGVLEGTKVIIGILYRDYWASNDLRKKIINKQNYDREKEEENKILKFHNEIMFKKKKTEYKKEKIENINKKEGLVKYSHFRAFYNKIISIFK